MPAAALPIAHSWPGVVVPPAVLNPPTGIAMRGTGLTAVPNLKTGAFTISRDETAIMPGIDPDVYVREGNYGWTQFQDSLSNLHVEGAGAFQYVDQLISQQAQTLGANDLFRLFTVLFIFLVPMVWLAKPPFGSRGGMGGH